VRFTAQAGYAMVKKSIEIRHYRSPMKGFRFKQTTVFFDWYSAQNSKTQTVVSSRLRRIQNESYFGWVKKFDGITELKWTSGLRLYLAEQGEVLMLLLGGNKNGQKKDIEEAKSLLEAL